MPDDLSEAAAYRDSLVPRADEYKHGLHPLWHGWAIVEAYMAGAKAEREKQGRKATTPGMSPPRSGGPPREG